MLQESCGNYGLIGSVIIEQFAIAIYMANSTLHIITNSYAQVFHLPIPTDNSQFTISHVANKKYISHMSESTNCVKYKTSPPIGCH